MWRNESTPQVTRHLLTRGNEAGPDVRRVEGRAGRFRVYRAGTTWWQSRPEWVFPTVAQAKAFAENL